MLQHCKVLKKLFQDFFNEEILSVQEIPLAGSDRYYYRLKSEHHTAIGTVNTHQSENNAFHIFASHLYKIGINVPQVLIRKGDYYLQNDLGDISFFHLLPHRKQNPSFDSLMNKVLEQLVNMQYKGHFGLDYTACFNGQKFDYNAIMADLYYFKYYFLRPQKIVYDGQLVIQDFNTLAYYLLEADSGFFMMRDFQSRNIMIFNDVPYFIDFQGGKQGPLQYDLVSLLWQAKGGFTENEREKYTDQYIKYAQKIIGARFNENKFRKYLPGFVLIRLLQVLGSYGYRGLFEKRPHFLQSIPLALDNIQWWLANYHMPITLPELTSVLQKLTSENIYQRFSAQKKIESDLIVNINSFSFKEALPTDETENGGGFVFDCRFIYNPGRHEEFKNLTGRDESVKQYLLNKTNMPKFLEQVNSIIDDVIQVYNQRGFKHLQINFGCTGGQHRSVFAADSTAQYIQNKFGLQVHLHHIVQERKNWVN